MLSMNISRLADPMTASPGTAPVIEKFRNARVSDPVTGSKPANTLGLPWVTVKTLARSSSMSPSNARLLRICAVNVGVCKLTALAPPPPLPQPEIIDIMEKIMAVKSIFLMSVSPLFTRSGPGEGFQGLAAVHRLRHFGASLTFLQPMASKRQRLTSSKTATAQADSRHMGACFPAISRCGKCAPRVLPGGQIGRGHRFAACRSAPVSREKQVPGGRKPAPAEVVQAGVDEVQNGRSQGQGEGRHQTGTADGDES